MNAVLHVQILAWLVKYTSSMLVLTKGHSTQQPQHVASMGGLLETIAAARDNLLAPPLLFFVLGIVATRVRSDLAIPAAIAQRLSIYLLAAIGLKGGWRLREAGFSSEIALQLAAAVALGLAIAMIAFLVLDRRRGGEGERLCHLRREPGHPIDDPYCLG